MAANKSYRVRLSTDVVPEHYDLRLEPDLDRFTFDGNVKITCNVAVATDTISVNTKELLILGATFTPVGGVSMKCNEITVRVKEMTSTFNFDEVLPVGNGVLEIKFRGTLNSEMAGFYRSEYTNDAGEKKRMAVTQFEAIDARRCFPCWDEPGCKAVFVVTMVYAQQYTCLCNMPPSRREILPDGRALETFMPSPKMSTYLLAFCVGEYEFISAQAKGGTLCRIFCRPGMLSKCDFALQQCVQALDFYDDFFGVPYPLPKMDMIAIPDFSAGAMENWGLVTYREVLLLCDVKTVSASQKKLICTVITHELAHQWFGNLVTMEWWDDLWLNEGFANFMQTFAADALQPEWKVWDTYVAEDQAQALRLDSLRSSHPIQVPIAKAEEVEEVFDAISYCKGGAVVRMIKAVIGLEKFQEGLKIYFQRHQYGNTETTDLWRAWSEASGKPIDAMMGSWTVKMGFPVLKVLNDPCEGGGNIEVEQSWFLSDGSVEAGDDEKVWVIPVFAGSDKAVAEVAFVDQKKQSISEGGTAAGASWLKLNFGQQAPIRVLYPPSMIARLAANVPSLPVVDRIGLLSDTYALCKSGALEPAQLPTLLRGYRGEASGKVWMELSATLKGLDRLMNLGFNADVGAAFAAFASTLVAPAFAQVGWDAAEGDDDNRKQLRATLVSAVAKFCAKEPAVASDAVRRCAAFVEAPADANALNADIRPAVLGIAMQGGNAGELFDQLVAAHNKVSDNAIKADIYAALGAAPTLELQTRALEWTLTDDVRLQDIVSIPMAVAGSRKEGAQCAFDWIKRDFDGLKAKMGTSGLCMTFQLFVKVSGAGFLTEEKAQEVKEFWESKPEVMKTVERALSQTLEGIRGNAKFAERVGASELSTAAFWAGASA